MKDGSRNARTPSRVVFFVLVLSMVLATALSAEPGQRKSFGHKNEPVTISPPGKERLTGSIRCRSSDYLAMEFARKSMDKFVLTYDDFTGLTVSYEYSG